jgi:hypothetical protein
VTLRSILSLLALLACSRNAESQPATEGRRLSLVEAIELAAQTSEQVMPFNSILDPVSIMVSLPSRSSAWCWLSWSPAPRSTS